MLPRRAAGPAALVVLALLVAGCSGGGGTAPAPGAAAPDATAQAKEAIRATFTGYGQALLRRDFAGACAALTDDARTAFVADLNAKGIPATTCEQAYTALYVTDAAKLLDEQGRSVQVVDVTVDGSAGTLTYTGTVKGRPVPPQTVRAQKVGDGWRIAPGR